MMIKALATIVLLAASSSCTAKLMEPAGGANDKRQLGGNARVGGFLFTMGDCPGKCLSYNSTAQTIHLDACVTAGEDKVWELDYRCGGNKDGFFRIRNVVESLCIADPENCASCNKEIGLVNCDSDRAALFSYGHLHKTSPKSHFLYSARCWLNEGLINVLSTPSMASKTCPQDFSVGACERLEWNLDHFSKDVLYYEWSYNDIRSECDNDLLFQ